MTALLRILDLSAGRRSIWIKKDHPWVTFLDCRPEVEPTMVCDTRDLSAFPTGYFDLLVFDPPHVNFGRNGKLSHSYGHHSTAEIRDIVAGTARQAYRVAKENALMAFRWNDHDQKLENIMSLLHPWWEPLFGQIVAARSTRVSRTYWVMLVRQEKV